MGRSKFPGKPPKTVTRKRIKVLGQSEASQSDSVTVAENIYYGLSLFNETFGDNEKEHPPFHGFSTKEATLSASYIKTQQHDAGNNKKKLHCNDNENIIPQENEEQNNTLVENCPSVNETDTEVLQNVIPETDQNSVKEVTISNSKRRSKINRSKNQRNCKNLKFSNFMKTPVLKSVKNILDQHQRTRQLRNSTAKRLLQRAKSNNNNTQNIRTQSSERASAVRKFVLPIRSAHSSRVIKPNKRFIEELEEISSMEHNENEVGLHVKKAKISTSKLDYQEQKLKEQAVNTTCTKSKDKETRNKVKKIKQQSTVRDLNHTKKRSEKSVSPTRSAQISKSTRKDVKNKVTDETPCKSHTILGSSQNVELHGEVTQDTKSSAKSIVTRNEKQTPLPTHDLPTVDVLSSESSRNETGPEILSETISDVAEINNKELYASCESNCPKNQHQCSSNKDTENNADDVDSESSLSESGSEHSNHTEDEQSEWSGMKLSGGKVILRKARLKLDNKCIGGTEGPFSSNTNNTSGGISNLGLTGTIKCGVCGAVRFYRFVKQARKFGIHSCESCRKFISKMIKRQAYAKSTNSNLPVLQCHKGDGLCLVPPVVRSQQWNLMRCVYKARCPACWLKMCLKCYNIPSTLRAGLNTLLPPLMRDPLSISLCMGQEESENQGQRLASCKTQWPAEDSLEKNLFKSAMGWKNLNFGHRSNYQTTTGSFLYPKMDRFDFSSNISPNKKRRKDNRIKVRKKIKNPIFSSPPVEQSPQPFRQRLELRGPRVKHVCRSASVALGQPIATFPPLDGKDSNENKHIPRMVKDNEKTVKNEEALREKQVLKNSEENIVTQNTNLIQHIHPKKGKSQQNISTSNLPMMSKTSDAIHTVCIDFWEQYDPVEVGTKGFALIGSEFFHISAICFLCGSAGKEPLIHCQCCCEPYHAFCLEPSEWNICTQPNWCCPRCTVCQSCHLRSGLKLFCVRCRQSFHHSCLSKSGVSVRLYSPDRPYVCQSCIKCKSCGSEGVNVYVGNLPLCSMCFKLRQRGNYCPLCQKCYNENDNDTKMMECSECSCWVHARCEGLSDEQYQILSHLPDSIEFTCCQCSADPNSTWRKAIEAQMKAGFISVIKTLSKNRKACAALKWNPRKECLCRSFLNMKKLEPSEEITSTDLVNGKRLTIDESEDYRSDKSEEMELTLSANLKADISNKIDYEEQVTDGSNRKGLRRLRQKFHLKECSVRVKNCIPKDETDKKDTVNSEILTNGYNNSKECTCLEQQVIVRPSPTLASIKRKINCNEYKSLSQFHWDMEQTIKRAGAKELVEMYHKVLQAIFPWFSISNFKPDIEVDNVLVPTKDNSKNTDSLSIKFDDPAADIWKKELLRMPKATASKAFNLHSTHAEDSRSCCLCKGLGDGQEMREGRLLYCGQNEWVHANCALWSNEVFEEIDGSLQNVHNAIARGRLIRCSECGKKGASIGCCAKNCNSTFHFPCARNAGLAFNEDKTVFCCLHLSNYSNKTLQNEIDFSVRRPIYVELDRKKKKYAEPNKVKMMIGSLLIDNLGSIIPEFSDSVEKIVPCEYKCSRLYWSTVNPFKIVRYYIRTYVQVYMPEASPNLENNITIDHSEERQAESTLTDVRKSENLTVKQTLESLIDSVCAKEVEEQNNTDFLPPELKEAIFEDLPHDLLDGISMQDIFPKVTYEDFLGMDLKTDGAFSADLLKDDILTTEVEEIIKPPENKVTKLDQSLTELNSQSDFWIQVETKGSAQDVVDDLYQSKNQRRGGRELKRSKSEVLPTNSLIIGAQKHHQRSCSLTWSCKLDNNYPSTMKRRKLPRNTNAAKSGETGVSVLDLQSERSSMLHELRLPESIMVAVGKTHNTPAIMSDSIRELKCSREEGKEHKRLFWHTRQQPRILQVDGPADSSSASECSSPEYSIEENTASLHAQNRSRIPQLDGINDESSCESNEWNSVENKDSGSRTHNSNFSQAKRILGFIRSHVTRDSAKRSEYKANLFRNNNVKLNLKIPQFDGADDISSDDDCISPSNNENGGVNNIPQSGMANDHSDRPVTCKRCRCTYRTQDSYNRHLTNCDIMVTSDSDSETMDNKLASPDSRFSPSIGSVSPQFITLSPSEGHTLSSDYSEIQATSPIEASIPSPHPSMQIEPIAQAIITPQIHTHATVETVHQTVLTSNDMIVQTQYTRTTTTLPNATVLPQESSVQITEITDSPSVLSNSGVRRNVVNVPLTSPDSSSSQTVPSPQVSPTFLSTGVQTATNNSDTSQTNVQAAKVSKTKSPRAPKSRTKGIKSQIVKNVVQSHNGQVKFQPAQNNTPVIQLQQAQRPSGPTVILQQVASPNIMSAYVETLQQQSGQNLQYIATLGNQHETGFKPQFITTNQLVPGTYIQTPSDNLLALQNGGISILPSVQIAQTQPTVLGTIIQQPPNAIQCGVISSEQLLLSSAPALEMFTDSTGSMFVSNQPMYYGLETIVSNTVMSSSQFMTGTVPQVLASSYQTTTQVFQASKLIEPIVDVQTVSTVPTVTAVQAVQNVSGVPSVPSVPNVPNVPTMASIPSMPNIPNVPTVSNVPSGYVVVNQTAPIAESLATSRISISTAPETNYTPVVCDPISTAPCQSIVETVAPVRMSPDVNPREVPTTAIPAIATPSKPPAQQTVSSIPKVAVRPSPVSQPVAQLNTESWKITEALVGTEQPINNNVRPYFDSKHVSENTSMIKSSISSKVPPLPNHCVTQRSINVNKLLHDVNNVHNTYSNTVISSNNVNVSTNSSPVISNANVQNKITMPTNNVPTSRPMNRVLPMQAVTPKQDLTESLGKSGIVIEEPTKPVMKAAEPEAVESKKSIVKAVEPVKKAEPGLKDTNDMIKLNSETIEKVKEDLKIDTDKDKLQNTPLKIVLQKQLQDGSYKITHNMKPVTQSKKSPQVASVEILPTKQVSQIASLQLLPLKSFTLKTNKVDENVKPPDSKVNVLKTKTPPVAVKKPRVIAKSMKAVPITPPNPGTQKPYPGGPSLMYEIKSQDGFTHTASSMSEVWETVFRAVQNARKAHNLPPLHHNPLSENLGLENNATIYLVEQLPGVNRCTKYKPKFHNLKPSKPNESENDLPTECDNGAARAEPFKGRKVHDMFSWLASRHRQQPKMIAISEAESRQRVASTNLPMAMRFRILKETSKESVGVYHSHIHGRGLFCLRDIEAGEMVIEYAGEVIRASLTDKREKYYDSKNIGCYMFKIDDHLVVDATMKGNAARFINHSCEPNCYSRVVDILGKKHILIFALRRIVQGEELTYDYKFPFEDIKIPCTCGSRRCRKYLN